MKDVSAGLSLRGIGVKFTLNTGESSTVAESAALFGKKPFRICTWAGVHQGKGGTPAWKEHPEETWLWNR